MKKILLKDGMEVSIVYRMEDFSKQYIQYVVSIDYQTGTTVTEELRSNLGVMQLDFEPQDDMYSTLQGISGDGFLDLLIAEEAKAPGDRCDSCGGGNLIKLSKYMTGNIDKKL